MHIVSRWINKCNYKIESWQIFINIFFRIIILISLLLLDEVNQYVVIILFKIVQSVIMISRGGSMYESVKFCICQFNFKCRTTFIVYSIAIIVSKCYCTQSTCIAVNTRMYQSCTTQIDKMTTIRSSVFYQVRNDALLSLSWYVNIRRNWSLVNLVTNVICTTSPLLSSL